MILTASGIILMLFGLLVSIVFWIPGVVDRNRIKAVLGRRYLLVQGSGKARAVSLSRRMIAFA